jgi:coenzyme Q-binding protein COQ10
MAHLDITRATAAPADALWEALTDPVATLRAVAGVEVVDASDSTDDRVVRSWRLRLRGSPLAWRQEERADEDRRCVAFRMTDGEPRHVAGTWHIHPGNDGRATVALHLELDFGLPDIAEVIDRVLGRAFAPVVDGVVAEAERRAGTPRSLTRTRGRG